jgi:glutaminyl-tRNA synthetase
MASSDPQNFIRAIIDVDLASNKHGGRVVTRFPPEPNGYLHIGHSKSICLNFGIVQGLASGVCHLRFDDTNPLAEDTEFVEAIQEDVRWLGFEWGDKLFFASDYFERIYQFAEELISKGDAYVCSLSDADARVARGSITAPGSPSPDRDRPVAENLDLFRRMRSGAFADGELVLRAKIDMAATNMKMRDPAIYRIRHTAHHRTGTKWCIYPLYDFTHCLSDSLEGITHSLCTLEFENNRELYDWFLDRLDVPAHPQQIEFARLALTYTVMSKRKLRELVEDGHVSGWDDPRMPTLRGLRRCGYTSEAIRTFVTRLGVAKTNSTVDIAQLEFAIREDLNDKAPRVLCVLRPLEVVIENYPEGASEDLDASYFPDDVPREGSRKLPFGRTLVIDRDDFREDPPDDYHRLAPGREVRLRHAYVIRCERVEKDATGHVVRLICSYDVATRNAPPKDGRRVKGTIHWLSLAKAVPLTVNLYDRLFSVEAPDQSDGPDFKTFMNPKSLEVVRDALIEPSVKTDAADTRYQFERLGFFWRDPKESTPERLIMNRIVSLKDSWAKVEQTRSRGSSDESARQRHRRDERERFKATQVEQAKQRTLELTARGTDYKHRLGLPAEQAHVLSTQDDLGHFFEQALPHQTNARALAGWVATEVAREAKERAVAALPFGPRDLAELVELVETGRISARAAKQVFAELSANGGSPALIVKALGLDQVADRSVLEAMIDEVFAQFPDKVAAYRAGNTNLMGLFVGQVMKKSGGRADPKLLAELLGAKLSG